MITSRRIDLSAVADDRLLTRPTVWGYITPSNGSKDVNVRSSDIQHDGGYRALSEGQEVAFEVNVGPNGPQAKNVKLVE